MKFLTQTRNGKIIHDFVFALEEEIIDIVSESATPV